MKDRDTLRKRRRKREGKKYTLERSREKKIKETEAN